MISYAGAEKEAGLLIAAQKSFGQPVHKPQLGFTTEADVEAIGL